MLISKLKSINQQSLVIWQNLQSKRWWRSFALVAWQPLLYSAVFGALWLKPRLYSLSYNNLDPSYIYGVQKAAENHEAFGQQFISNYGPLSYLVINFLPDKAIYMTFGHILAALAAGTGTYFFCKLFVKDKAAKLLAAVLLLFTLAWAGPEWLYLNLFILYAFIYLKLRPVSPYKQRLLLGLVAFSVMCALTKFTIGLVSIVGVAIIVLTERVPSRFAIKDRVWFLAKLGLGYLIALVAVGYVLGVKNIVAYALASFQVASGFSGAMGLNDPNLLLATKYISWLFIALFAWLVISFKRDVKYYAFLVPALFIVFKYCATRQDGHVLAIVQVLAWLAIIVYFLRSKLQAYDGVFLAVICSLAIGAMWTNYTDFKLFNLTIHGPITNVAEKQAFHFLNLPAQKRLWRTQTDAWLQTAKLPESMRKKIGNNPVDVFPWETVVVAANNLQWHNRPSPYAFETYTEPLDILDETFIKENGPKYIIWHRFGEPGVIGIDNRNLLWDGPETVGALLQNYKTVEVSDGFVLFERKGGPAKTEREPVLATGKGGEWLAVPKPKTGMVCASIVVHHTLKQKAYKVVLRERPFFIDVAYADGTLRSFRFVSETSPNGLIISPLPYDWPTLTSFFEREAATSQTTVAKMRVSNEPTAKVTFTDCNE